MDPARFDEMRPGCFDIAARIEDMDRAGIWASLCFPSLVSGFCGAVYSRAQDKDLGLACLRAFNDWHLDVWAAYRARAHHPAAAAVAGRRRGGGGGGRGERGPRLQGGELPRVPGPAEAAVHLQRRLGPLLRRLRGDRHRRLPAHRMRPAGRRSPSHDPPFELLPTFFPVNALLAAGEWLWSGVPLRFPKLNIAMSEGGIGWVTMLMDRADYVLGALGVGHREPLVADRPAAERGAAAELLVLLHRRPVRGGASAT